MKTYWEKVKAFFRKVKDTLNLASRNVFFWWNDTIIPWWSNHKKAIGRYLSVWIIAWFVKDLFSFFRGNTIIYMTGDTANG